MITRNTKFKFLLFTGLAEGNLSEHKTELDIKIDLHTMQMN